MVAELAHTKQHFEKVAIRISGISMFVEVRSVNVERAFSLSFKGIIFLLFMRKKGHLKVGVRS
jgi:hypothetical protein